MTVDNTPEADEAQVGNESDEESAPFKALRASHDKLEKEIKELKRQPSRSDIEAEVRASLARTQAIEGELVALKLPAGLSETVEGRLGDAEVSREAVTEALKAIGFAISEDEGGEDQQVAEGLAQVAGLGNQIAAAASGETKDNFDDELAATENPEDVAALMRKRGLGG